MLEGENKQRTYLWSPQNQFWMCASRANSEENYQQDDFLGES